MVVELTVCIGEFCHLKGAEVVVQDFKQLIDDKQLTNEVKLKGKFCLGKCNEEGISVAVDGERHCIQADDAKVFFEKYVESKVGKS